MIRESDSSTPLDFIYGIAVASARIADSTGEDVARSIGRIAKSALEAAQNAERSLPAIFESPIADRLRRATRQTSQEGRDAAERGRQELVRLQNAIQDWLILYLREEVLPAAAPDVVDDLIPYLVDSAVPQIMDGLMPRIEDEYLPALLDAASDQPALLAVIRSGSQGTVHETAESLRGRAVKADDRIEASFRRLVRRQPRPDSAS